MSYYHSEIKHYVAVDCVIFGFQQGSLNLLLLKRKMEPAQGQWSLMGGFVREGESVDDAAKRVLAELTGLENVYMEQVHTFGAINRDPGERVISVVYYALINIDEYDRELVHEHNAYWVNIDEVPPLIFDHEEMVAQAREKMKQKAAREPIGFNLLPKLFTLTRLQSLYPFLLHVKPDNWITRRKQTCQRQPDISQTDNGKSYLFHLNHATFSSAYIIHLHVFTPGIYVDQKLV